MKVAVVTDSASNLPHDLAESSNIHLVPMILKFGERALLDGVDMPPGEFYKAKTALLQAFPGTEWEVQEITFLPQTSKTISPEDLPMFQKLIAMLNDCDDVQDVYHNADLPS